MGEPAPAVLSGGILLAMHSLSQGGGDRNGVVLASGFARAGIRTSIVLMRDGGEAEPELRSLLDPRIGVTVAGPPLSVPLEPQAERLRGLPILRRQIEQFRPSAVLGVTDNMALTTALARTGGAGGPLFAQKLTNRIFRPALGPFRRTYRYNLFKFIVGRLDLVITLTEAERRDATGHYPGRPGLFRTVPNPHVTDEMLAPAGPREPGPPRLLAAGRMVPQKRFDVLLRAFAQLGHADARLTILGDGPLRGDLERLSQSLGIGERLHMPGYDPDIVAWIQKSDLVVLSSDYEGLPGVVIRALACNVPVATTDSFLAAHELLGKARSCGIVPTGDPGALADAIDRSLEADRSEDLRKLVQPYRVDTAIKAHIEALARAVEERAQ